MRALIRLFLLALLPLCAAVQAQVSLGQRLSDALPTEVGYRIPIPAGSWEVVGKKSESRTLDVTQHVALKNTDESSDIPYLVVRYASKLHDARWGDACLNQQVVTPIWKYRYDTQPSQLMEKCQRVWLTRFSSKTLTDKWSWSGLDAIFKTASQAIQEEQMFRSNFRVSKWHENYVNIDIFFRSSIVNVSPVDIKKSFESSQLIPWTAYFKRWSADYFDALTSSVFENRFKPVTAFNARDFFAEMAQASGPAGVAHTSQQGFAAEEQAPRMVQQGQAPITPRDQQELSERERPAQQAATRPCPEGADAAAPCWKDFTFRDKDRTMGEWKDYPPNSGNSAPTTSKAQASPKWVLPIDSNQRFPEIYYGGENFPLLGLKVSLESSQRSVYAPEDGVVLQSGRFNSLSWGFLIRHPNGLLSLIVTGANYWAHIDKKSGDFVNKRDLLGRLKAASSAGHTVVPLNWEVYRAEGSKFAIGDSLAAIAASATGELPVEISADLIRQIRNLPEINVKALLKLGVVWLEEAERGSLRNPEFVMSGTPLIAQPDSKAGAADWRSAYLAGEGTYELAMTTGLLLRDTERTQVTVKVGDVTRLRIQPNNTPQGRFETVLVEGQGLRLGEQPSLVVAATPLAAPAAAPTPAASSTPQPDPSAPAKEAADRARDQAERDRLAVEAQRTQAELQARLKAEEDARRREQQLQEQAERDKALAEAQRTQLAMQQRLKAEEEARQKERLAQEQAQQKARQEQAEREKQQADLQRRLAAEEQARRQMEQKAKQDQAERDRLAAEAQRTQAELQARLKAEAEARQKAQQEKELLAQRAQQEQAERDKAMAEAQQKAKRDQAERERLAAENERLRAELTKAQQNARPANVAYRKAFVVGIDSYRHITKLATAREDARAMASALTGAGFSVSLHLDLGEKDLRAAWRKFATEVDGGDEVAFFFAGHGVQLSGLNYLIPADVAGDSEWQLRDDSIPLQRLLDDMTERKAKLTLAVIDACRDNPFRIAGRNVGNAVRGLAPTTPATGQMVIFSAGAGQRALDNLGPNDRTPNGVFTRVFVQEMKQRGIPVDAVARRARSEVVRLAKSIGHEQVPAIYDQLVGEFFLLK